MATLRCATCNMTFDSAEAQRAHYAADVHLHNVRLRVDGKLPVSNGEFLRSGAAGYVEDASEAPVFHCKLCNKTFRSVQTLQSHVKSTGHLMKKEQRIIDRDGDAASSALTSTSLGSAALGLHKRHKAHHPKKNQSGGGGAKSAPHVPAEDREVDVSATRCMFCGHGSETVEANEQHLTNVHGFVIPLSHRCHDVPGLLEYLARKVNGLMCLVCGERSKLYESLEAVRAHMRTADHMKIDLGSEYQEFYDGPLVNLDEEEEQKFDGQQISLAGGRVAIKRDEKGLGMINKGSHETEAQRNERRAIADKNVEDRASAKNKALEASAPYRNLEMKDRKRLGLTTQKQMLHAGTMGNHLHVKGYDGNANFS